jgi:hypothetical protein
MVLAVAILLPPLAAGRGRAAETRSIAGEWRVALDPEGVGLAGRWFERSPAGRMALPGSIDEARLAPANPAPPTLDGLHRTHPYEGVAWFESDLLIPGSWAGKRVSLVLERVHWETRVWVDGKEVPGIQDSLVAPHVHDLGPLGAPGTRRLTIRVDNTKRHDLGGFVSILYEGTQTNWNGIVGAIELRAVDPVAIDDVQVYPDLARRVATVKARLSNASGAPARGRLRLALRARAGAPVLVADEGEVAVDGPGAQITRELALPAEVAPWDEFRPNLFLLQATLSAEAGGKPSRDERAVRFGLREAGTRGTQVTLNGRPIFLRGTLDCAIYPRTGYPPTDAASWRKIYRTIKAYGLNFVRFHSWCPPEAAFAAADVEGVYLQPEGPQANVDVGRDPARDAFVEAELRRIVRTYGHHPSFLLMALGNEYGGTDAILSGWIDMLKREDPRHLYASPAAGQATANRQFTEGGPRGVKGPGTAHDFRAELAREDRPLLGHEIGQWTFYPAFDEIPKYDGVLAARNFELVREDLRAKGMLDLAPAFVAATGRHATLLYKEEIEVLLRTPGYAGFSLLDLHDYPGQGTALVGLLDPFWESKGFVTPEAHARYAGPMVPLLRLPKRVYTTAEPLVATAEIAPFGPADLEVVEPIWSVRDGSGRVLAEGVLPSRSLPMGTLATLGAIRADLSRAPAPAKLTVRLELKGTAVANEWEVWVYPPDRSIEPPAGVVLGRSWDDATKAALAAGKAVVLVPRTTNPRESLPGRFLPVFWSPIWFPDQKPNTMGLLLDPGHPALAGFPTESHSNWQWYELLDASRTLRLDDAPAALVPIVRVVDNFRRNGKLANVVEARVGPGRLLLATIDLPRLADSNPAARQLLGSLLSYAGSERFRPTVALDPALLDRLLLPARGAVMSRLGARVVRADGAQPGYEATNLLDDDPETMWHTPWGEGAAPFPHEVVVGFDREVRLSGVECVPRADQANGRIRDYRVETSADGRAWRVAASGAFPKGGESHRVAFAAPTAARFVKLVALSGFDDRPFASLAEFTAVEAAP